MGPEKRLEDSRHLRERSGRHLQFHGILGAHDQNDVAGVVDDFDAVRHGIL